MATGPFQRTSGCRFRGLVPACEQGDINHGEKVAGHFGVNTAAYCFRNWDNPAGLAKGCKWVYSENDTYFYGF